MGGAGVHDLRYHVFYFIVYVKHFIARFYDLKIRWIELIKKHGLWWVVQPPHANIINKTVSIKYDKRRSLNIASVVLFHLFCLFFAYCSNYNNRFPLLENHAAHAENISKQTNRLTKHLFIAMLL